MRPIGPAHLASQVRRSRDIVSVFTRHGLVDALEILHLQPVRRVRRLFRPHRSPADEEPTTRAERLRMAFEELGPTFVKFGQALSVRSDLLPEALVSELSKLQDDVPPLPAGAAERAIEKEFGQPLAALFSDFDPVPLGSASIAQVHGARLPSGEPVAVKVRRPDIQATIEADLAILEHLARLLARYWADAELYDPCGLVRQFGRTIRLELDLAREGRLIERFAHNFEGDPSLVFPRVHWERTRPAVLTMDFMAGRRISDLGEAGSPAFDARIVARRGADAVLKQILVDGLFHGDPHPGNILVFPDNVICLLDFGIVGHLNRDVRHRLIDLIRAIPSQDVPRVARALVTISQPLADLNMPELQEDVTDLLDSYAGSRLQDLSLTEMLRDVVDVIARHRLKLPPDLMLLVKALATIEGVGRQLDDSFRMIEHAVPFVERLLAERLAPEELTHRIGESSRDLAESVQKAADDIGEILSRARVGRLQLQVSHRNLEPVADELARSSVRLSYAVVAAALVIGVALLLHSGRPWSALAAPSVITGGALAVAGILFALGRVHRRHTPDRALRS